VSTTLEIKCVSQDHAIIIMMRKRVARRTGTDVFGTRTVACAAQEYNRCGAAFNGDETDCAGVLMLMIVLMTKCTGQCSERLEEKRSN